MGCNRVCVRNTIRDLKGPSFLGEALCAFSVVCLGDSRD